jgi:hypothetical protein
LRQHPNLLMQSRHDETDSLMPKLLCVFQTRSGACFSEIPRYKAFQPQPQAAWTGFRVNEFFCKRSKGQVQEDIPALRKFRYRTDKVTFSKELSTEGNISQLLIQFPVSVLQCEFGLLLNPRSGAIVNVPLPFPSMTSKEGSLSSP